MMPLLEPTRFKRSMFFLIGDSILLAASLIVSYYLRFEFKLPPDHAFSFLLWLPGLVLLKLLFLRFFNLYSISWSFVGIVEFANILKAMTIVLFVTYVGNLYLQVATPHYSVPRSILLIDFILSIFAISAFRISKRAYLEVIKGQPHGKLTVIVGAGPTGERLAREFLRSESATYYPYCFVDDNPSKVGSRIHGVPVLGTIEAMGTLLKDQPIEVAIIAITTLNHLEVKRIFDKLVDLGIREIKVVPHISRLPERAITVRDIQDLNIEDLLYREPVTIEEDKVREFLTGKTVLVTGAGGSIGSEIVRQLIRFYPSKVIALDVDETEIFNLMQSLKGRINLDIEIVPFVGDIRIEESLEKLFSAHHPEVVFHAAAYKHVPMMEHFPDEALRTNVMGTYQLGRAALRHGTERFINISTDKAVNPSSIMGATKRTAEMVCSTLNTMNGTHYVSVRFGNVLASRGSVVPIFLEQIKNGGPVTVTHPDMQRYFMTIPEAVILVFQAAAMGRGGEVFVLDMGKPVSILQMAEDLIRLNHLEPYRDIRIEFPGLRPGEKLFEELLTAEEGTSSTTHQQIFIARNTTKFTPQELDAFIDGLGGLIRGSPQEIKAALKKIVPYYSGMS